MGRVKGREYFLAFNKVQPPRTPAERRQHMTNTFDVNAWWNEWVEALRATDYAEVGAPTDTEGRYDHLDMGAWYTV